MDQAKPSNVEDDHGFGDWDIRKEQNVRPKVEESQFENVEKKEFNMLMSLYQRAQIDILEKLRSSSRIF